MAHHRKTAHRPTRLSAGPAATFNPSPALKPLGAMLLAGSLSSFAQEAPMPAAAATLPTVTVREKAEKEEDRDTLRAVDSAIGKGKQALRDIPQSLTVVTEKLMDDRNLDTLK